MSRADTHAAALARRLGAALSDLRELAEIEPALAQQIRAALVGQLAEMSAPSSLTERALGEG